MRAAARLPRGFALLVSLALRVPKNKLEESPLLVLAGQQQVTSDKRVRRHSRERRREGVGRSSQAGGRTATDAASVVFREWRERGVAAERNALADAVERALERYGRERGRQGAAEAVPGEYRDVP
jgi:hypothetical protein